MKEKTSPLEKAIAYTFNDKQFLQTALTHKTYAFEAENPIEYNERLEFLGDSILNFIIAEAFYHTNAFFTEGELTRRRSFVVNNKILAKKAKQLHIGDYLLLGKGEQNQNGNKNPSNLANVLEALIGAIYLDSNYETVKKIILTHLFKETFS